MRKLRTNRKGMNLKGTNRKGMNLKGLNRKGMSDKAIVVIVIAVIMALGALSLFMWVRYFADDATYDQICGFGVAMRDKTELLNMHFFIEEFCVTRPKDIWPDDWEKCNETFKVNEDLSGCLAEQVVKLAKTCWVIRGSGGKDVGDMDCYTITIFEPNADKYKGESISVDHKLLKKVMNTYGPPGGAVYSDSLSNGLGLTGELKPNQEWTVQYIEDVDVAIFGILFPNEDSVTLVYEGGSGTTCIKEDYVCCDKCKRGTEKDIYDSSCTSETVCCEACG